MSSYSPGKIAIAICGRCGLKKPYRELREDGNIKGLYVCSDDGCYDDIDPYKLPPRQPDAFTLHHPRPDLPISTVPRTITLLDGEVLSTDTDDTLTP